MSLNEVINGNDWHRFDPEYFKKEATAIIENIKNRDYVLIGDCFDVSKLAGFEFTEYFTPQNMSSADCYIALTSKNIQRESLVLNEYITIDKTVAKANLQRSKIKYGDVILSYTGEYRRSLVMQDTVEYQLGPNICRIRQKGKRLNPFFLSTFLNSSIGQTILDKEKTLSAQPTVAMSRIRQIPVPICSIQEDIEKIIRDSYKFNNASCKIYDYAEKLLLKELGFEDWQQSTDNISIKTLKDSFCSSGRLDAEYYQPKYDELESKIKSHNWATLQDLCLLINHGMQPPYIENGEMRVFSQKWIKDKEIDYSFIEDREEPRTSMDFAKANPDYVCRKNDIVHYSVGANIGFCHTYLSDVPMMPGSFITLIRADEKKVNPIYLGVVLNSIVGRLQSEKRKSGTAQPYVYPKDLKEFIIPILPTNIQDSIAAKIQESFALRHESERLLEVAKKAVEIAISENEDNAMNFILQNIRT